jgi:hypothetical protein
MRAVSVRRTWGRFACDNIDMDAVRHALQDIDVRIVVSPGLVIFSHCGPSIHINRAIVG